MLMWLKAAEVYNHIDSPSGGDNMGNKKEASIPVSRIFDLMRYMVEHQEFYREIGGIPTEVILKELYGNTSANERKKFLRDRTVITEAFGDCFSYVSKRKKRTKAPTDEDGVTRWLFIEPWKSWRVKSPVKLRAFPDLVWSPTENALKSRKDV